MRSRIGSSFLFFLFIFVEKYSHFYLLHIDDDDDGLSAVLAAAAADWRASLVSFHISIMT